MKRVLFFLVLFYSCGPSDGTSVNGKSDSSDFSIKNIDRFEFVFDTASFDEYVKYYKRNPKPNKAYANFFINMHIVNNSPNEINTSKFEGYIIADFADGEKLRFPYHSGGMHVYNEDGEEIWRPGESNFVKFRYMGSDVVMRTQDLPIQKFNRTPESCKFIIEYNLLGVDGEYRDIIELDMLDKWTDFQKTLGLR